MTSDIFHNNKILIIEDEISIRSALRDKFVREGFVVYDAKDCEEGLAMAFDVHPHIIILDKVMPRMDGMVMLKTLRTVDRWSFSVPVILLTNADTDDERIIREIDSDAYTFYAVKSNLSMSDVVQQVRRRLASRENNSH